MATAESLRKKVNQGKMTPRPKFRVVGEDSPPQLSSVEKAYYRQLHRQVDDIFVRAEKDFGMTWYRLAHRAGLAYQTVANLGYRFTKFPRHMTIFKLARAVGMELSLKELPKKKTKSKLKVVG